MSAAILELEQEREELEQRREANRAEQTRVAQMLTNEVRAEFRLPPTISTPAARATLARLRAFTVTSAMAALGWKRKQVKDLIDAMECEVPPTIERLDNFEGQRVYRILANEEEEQEEEVERQEEVERDATSYERMLHWVRRQRGTFSPGQCAAANDVSRLEAIRALHHMADAGIVDDQGPTEDMPIFTVVDAEVPEPPPPPPPAEPEVKRHSKIPEIQAMLEAAEKAGLAVTSTNEHHVVEGPDGRVVIPDKVTNRKQVLQDKARIRRMGAKL